MENGAAARIREAFAAGDFAKAEAAWNAYADGVREAIRAGRGEEALAGARELIQFARLSAKCMHAHAAARLGEAGAASAYSAAPARHSRLHAIL